jgi:sugar phosphate permease
MNRRLVVLIACFFAVLISYSIRYGYGVLLPKMLPSLDISKTEAGVIYASFFIAYTVFSPLLGLMGDRFDVRLLLTAFAAVLGTGTFLMAYASSLTRASLFFTLAGIGSAACWAPVMALAQRWTSDKHRGKTLAFVDIGSALGIVGSSTILPQIVSAHDWRAGWITLGSLGFAVSLMLFLSVKNSPGETSEPRLLKFEQRTREPVVKVYLKLLRNRVFWLIGLAYLLTGFTVIIPFTFLTTFAEQELNFPYATAARFVLIIGICAIISKISLGSLSDKTRRINIMMSCALLIAAGCLGMALHSGLTLIIFTIVFGIGYGVVWAMYAASASDYFSKELAGSIVGLWTLYLGVGSTISPIIAGWLADTTGTLSWSFVMAAAGAVVSVVLLIPVWRLSQGNYPGKEKPYP